MHEGSAGDVVDLLTRAEQGDAEAAEALIPQVYDALRALARRQMARERPGHTLQPTALVNEAYVRLVGDGDTRWNSRGHFFAAAAQAMRRILVERARKQRRLRHGGGRARVSLDEAGLTHQDNDPIDLIAMDEALDALEQQDPRAAQIVALRFFIGLTAAETANVLGVSERSVRRDWSCARLWLFERMAGGDDA